ncbi:hypothetical protein [Pseudomonas protegens]|uniref:hypothetical protein n=1 Tax=Pseudomonas protegens TaxID=380021 RepID=UPI00384C64D8
MNDPKLAITKIEELMKASRESENLFEHAAAFAAISVLIDQLDQYFEEKAPYAGENVSRLRSHTAAMLGYDITNNHSPDQHYSWSLAAISGLEGTLRRSTT